MSKAQMPDPIATRADPHLSGRSVPLYSPVQMQVYADERVAEALREAVRQVEILGDGLPAKTYGYTIRALIPHLPA